MRIELANLQGERSDFAHSYQPAELDLADERVKVNSPVSIVGTVRRSRGGVQVQGQIVTRVQVECDRCLKSVTFPVDNRFAVEYISEEDYKKSSAAELTEKEMSVSVFAGETIDIDELVREQILLTVPARVLCTADCKGMCPTCGADLNLRICNCETREVDPRWEELKKLKTSL